jgi:hypothetical protein
MPKLSMTSVISAIPPSMSPVELKIANQIEIFSVDGRHRGVASIMRQPGVQVIADHITDHITDRVDGRGDAAGS